MQPIISNNYYNRYQNQPSFKASYLPPILAIDSKLTARSKSLLKRGSELIEQTWTDIKKGKSYMSEPHFIANSKHGEAVTFKPVYNGQSRMMLEIEGEKFLERITFSRKKVDDFKYEKYAITDYGIARVKSYDSNINSNPVVEDTINARIEDCLSKIVPEKTIYQMLLY